MNQLAKVENHQIVLASVRQPLLLILNSVKEEELQMPTVNVQAIQYHSRVLRRRSFTW